MVCRGLVLARIHQLYQVVPIVSQRCCRASYGIIQDEPYDKKIHRHLKHERMKSKVDGRYYLPGRIRWIIERDKPVDCGFSKLSFLRNVHGKDPGMLKHDIVRFDGEFRDRPIQFNGAAHILACKFRYNLEPALLRTNTENVRKQFKFRFIRLGEFWQVAYQIGFNVDSAGLGFDLWLGGEAKCSVGDIGVEWSKEVNTFVARDRPELVSSIIERGNEGD